MKRLAQLANIIRLFAFVLGYGLSGALVGSTLNRIMVIELNFPVSVVGLLFAVPIFIAPMRVWIGYRSDRSLLGGLRREPFIIIGALLAGIGVIIAILLIARATEFSVGLAAGVFIAFFVHEFGRNLSHNTFQALIAEKFSDKARARMIIFAEVFTLLGLIIGAGGISRGLADYNPSRLVSVTIVIAVAAFVLSVLAAFRSEPRGEITRAKAEQAQRLTFGNALRELALADKQVRLFFVIVVFTIIGTLAQDVLLEPYGGSVLNMTVAQTSALTQYWGLGVLAAMLLSSLVLIHFMGHITLLRIGLVATLFVFVGVIAIGFSGNVSLFRALVFVMGFGTGLAGAGMLMGIISFTTLIRAGLLMGIWGMAMIFGRAMGSLFGGVIVDVMRAVTGGNDLIAFGSVFAIEALLLLTAFALTARLNLSASAAYVEAQQARQQDVVLGAAGLAQ